MSICSRNVRFVANFIGEVRDSRIVAESRVACVGWVHAAVFRSELVKVLRWTRNSGSCLVGALQVLHGRRVLADTPRIETERTTTARGLVRVRKRFVLRCGIAVA